MANWNEAGSGAVTGAGVGTAIAPGIGTAIGAGVGGLIGLFSGSGDTPHYEDPNAIKRQIIADRLLNSKTGEEYSAHQAAMNEHRGQRLFDEVSKDFGNNPAVSASLYDKIEGNVENENTTAGIEGARINEQNAKEGASILSDDSQLGFHAWQDSANRAARPSLFDTIAGGTLSTLAGGAASKAARGSNTGDTTTDVTDDTAGSGGSVNTGAIEDAERQNMGFNTWKAWDNPATQPTR